MRKSWSKILAGALCFALAACNNDDIATVNDGDVENGVYMRFRLELPQTTRSVTDTGAGDDYVTCDGGIEIGTDNENKVTKGVLVVLTTPDRKFIASSYVPGSDGTEGDAANTYTMGLSETALRGQTGKNVLVYAFCNPTEDLIEKANKFNSGELLTVGNATYKISNAESMEISTGGKFLMSNAVLVTNTLPTSFAPYKTKESAYSLGTVKVERAVARFDYKQGPSESENGVVGSALYDVFKNQGGQTMVQVQLTEAALLNMSNEFYYLRRTCKQDGSGNADYRNFDLCGLETTNNYVVDYDFDDKLSYTGSEDLTGHFFYNVGKFVNNSWTSGQFASNSEWKWVKLTDITNKDENDVNNWQGGAADINKSGYRIWRYVTENTIPSRDRQKYGISTGIVFKGHIIATDNNPVVKAAMAQREPIYMYNNSLYARSMFAGLSESTAVKNAYNAVINDAHNGEPTDKNWTDHGFTIYNPNTNGDYEVLYYYWNRHNNNGMPAEMGVMEFAVVRNNVYKLCVDKISLLGHPTDPGKDPDPVDPGDPDESSDVYFKVSVQVLPWVVRVNSITFD